MNDLLPGLNRDLCRSLAGTDIGDFLILIDGSGSMVEIAETALSSIAALKRELPSTNIRAAYFGGSKGFKEVLRGDESVELAVSLFPAGPGALLPSLKQATKEYQGKRLHLVIISDGMVSDGDLNGVADNLFFKNSKMSTDVIILLDDKSYFTELHSITHRAIKALEGKSAAHKPRLHQTSPKECLPGLLGSRPNKFLENRIG